MKTQSLILISAAVLILILTGIAVSNAKDYTSGDGSMTIHIPDSNYRSDSSSTGNGNNNGYSRPTAPSQSQAEAQRAYEQSVANKRAQEELAQRDAAQKAAQEGAARVAQQEAEFQSSKSAAMSEMKGLGNDSAQSSQLKGLDSQPVTDSKVVDARNVPTGLPKFVEDSIPHTPAGDRVRKGFQAVVNHDWPVALAWFQDALNKEPGDPGLERLVDLAQFTLHRQQQLSMPIKTPDADTLKMLDENMKHLDAIMDEELQRALDDFYNSTYRKALVDDPPKNSNPYEPASLGSLKPSSTSVDSWSWSKFWNSLKPKRPKSVPAAERG